MEPRPPNHSFGTQPQEEHYNYNAEEQVQRRGTASPIKNDISTVSRRQFERDRTMLSEAFKDAMSMWASGVTLVTTTESGVWHGFTASSVASLSADPEMVLVCIALSADCYDAFVAASAFGVSVLGESDKDLASRFATKGSEKFADRRRWAEGVHGIPILKSAIAVLIARTVKAIPAGDHSVLLGGVVHASSQPGDPLVYWHRNYRSVGSLTDAVNKDSHTRQGE